MLFRSGHRLRERRHRSRLPRPKDGYSWMGTPQAAACVPASPRQAAHGRATTGASPGIRKPEPVTATPRHIRQHVGAGIRARELSRSGFMTKPSARSASPSRAGPSGCMTRLALAYRCGGSTGIAGRGSKPVAARTCFPFTPRAWTAVGHLERSAPSGAAARMIPFPARFCSAIKSTFR